MSERREKQRRINDRLEYIARYNAWLAAEPPKFRILKHRRWRRQQPLMLKGIKQITL